MPYRVAGATVYVKRGDRWVVLKKHRTTAEAMAHFRALQANVPEVHKKRWRR